MTYTVKSGENIFLAIGVPPHEAEVLQFRTNLVITLALWLRDSGLSHTEAAEKLGVTETKIIDLERTRWKKFKIDTLIDMAGRAGLKVQLTLNEAA